MNFSWGAKSEGAPIALSELTGVMDGRLIDGKGPSAIGEAEGNNDPSGFGGPSALPNFDADAIGGFTNQETGLCRPRWTKFVVTAAGRRYHPRTAPNRELPFETEIPRQLCYYQRYGQETH